MRALVHIGEGRLVSRTLPAVEPTAAGAVLEVEGSSVCIADSETLHGYGPVMATPLVLGHEIVGVVGDVGADAPEHLKRLQGTRVLIDDARPCGVCAWCLRDQKRFCKEPRYGHIVLDDSSENWGGYAEQVTLDSHSVLIPLPADLPIELATFTFPVASGVEWLRLGADLKPGESVAVLGTSRMGAGAVLVALHDQASRVVLYGDPRGRDAIRAVEQMGAETRDFPVNPAEEGPFDVVVVVTEAPVEYFAAAVMMAGPLGRVITACTSMSPSQAPPEIIRRKGLTIKGGRGASAASLEMAVEIVSRERDRLGGVMGEIYGFEDAPNVVKHLLSSGVARGAHVVIAGGTAKGTDHA